LPAPQELKELIERFERNYKQYTSQDYKEAVLRKEFLDPLFEMLGWDMANKAGNAEQYKDVVHEQSLDVEGNTKAPDYAFRIGGTMKFFVEAKKPSVDVGSDPKPAFQLRRYAWSAKLPLSILTNFEQTYVYDCRVKPSKDDKATTARIMHFQWNDLVEKWDELASVFSRESVLKGSFDRYAEEAKGKRGTTQVDDAFLEDIEEWRRTLAQNIAIRNTSLSLDEMNYAVGKLIDRIIFLRICEDRGMETAEQLRGITEKDDVYKRLVDLFQLADAKYNSGLFHFQREAKRTGHPDQLTPKLDVDDKILRDIIKSLYYPDSPYQFDQISADILGQVYEQFLGKVIRLTAGHQAKVEEKPEVKKAGGVYYTPKYIVDYIVENTVGKLCVGKTPDEMAKLRILDPACGSGSFLIVAYSRLLKEHLDWYTANNPKKWKDQIFQGPKGEWRLTLHEKKKILLNSIYGVDIDGQAVEVTKLNLLLKALEGESKESVDNVKKWFREPALPDLGENVKCGNSLVGPDVSEMLKELPPEEYEKEIARINPFDWKDEFPEAFKAGGFDAVVGNPPYVRQETLGDIKDYFQKHYQTYHGIADLYTYFIEKGVNLLKVNGLWGNIVANKWMRTNYGQPLRKWLKENHIVEILDFGALQVFTGATTYPCIMIVGKGKPVKSFEVVNFATLEPNRLVDIIKETKFQVMVDSLNDTGWALMGRKNTALIEKLKNVGKSLDTYVDGKIYYGIKTGLNEAFVIDEVTKARLIKEDQNSNEIIKTFLVGKDVKRYWLSDNKRYLIFTRRGIDIKQYPAIEKYLENFKEKLKPKPLDWDGKDWPGRKPGQYKWYEIQDTVDYYLEFEKNKIIWPGISKEVAAFAYDDKNFYGNDNNQLIITADLYLLGLLNSKLMKIVLESICDKVQGGFYRLKIIYIEQLPIRTLDLANPADKAQHDRLVALVERMLKLHKDRQAEKLPDRIEKIERQIQATDKEIDALVYELYGLTEEEIKIVEGAYE
jgi:type I restriction-modification system DNA methylase subunit